MVHGLHALPSGNRPGSPRSLAQLPNHGHGPDGHGSGQRVLARRRHGCGGGDGNALCGTTPAPSEGGQEPILGRRGGLPPDAERSAHPRGAPRHRHGRDDARRDARRGGSGKRLWMFGPVPRRQRRSGRHDRICGRHGGARGAHRVCRRFDGPLGLEESRCHGRRRGGGQLPTVWGSHGLRRTSCRLLCSARGLQASLPRPNHRRFQGPPRPTRVADGPPNP